MTITAELSLYPLENKYDDAILDFLKKLGDRSSLRIETTAMSTLITGDYDEVMEIITRELKKFMKDHTAVSIMKISNGCVID